MSDSNRRIPRRRSLLARATAIALAAGIAGFAAAPREAAAQTKITVGDVFLSATVWAGFVAEAKGFFKEHGLEVDMIATRSSSNAVQQLAAGSLNIASSGIPDYLRAIAQGAPIKIFMSQIGTPPYTIFAKPEITSISQLEGKMVMIGGQKDVTRHYTETLFNAAGLKEGSYDYLYAGSTANRFAALAAGGVDATILLPPLSFRAAAEGFSNLGNVQTVLADFPFTVHAYSIEWAKDHRDELVAYAAALLQATEWLYDTGNREEAADILVKATNFQREDALLTYDAFIEEMQAFSRNGAVSEDAYTKMMQVLVGWGDIQAPIPPLGDFYDPSIIADAAKLVK